MIRAYQHASLMEKREDAFNKLYEIISIKCLSGLPLSAPKLIFDVSRDGNGMVPSSGIFSELG